MNHPHHHHHHRFLLIDIILLLIATFTTQNNKMMMMVDCAGIITDDDNNKTSTSETVIIKSYADIKYFDLPTSDEPLVSWMDVQKGIFPNTSSIEAPLAVGDPISIFIYLKDDSSLYDMKVTDCWAYDDQHIDKSKNRLHLTQKQPPKTKTKLIEEWHKYRLPKDKHLQVFLYTDLTAFKFPDKDQIYLTCDIQLCFKTCEASDKLN